MGPFPLTIKLFGAPQFLIGDTPLGAMHTDKARWVLALLVLRQGGPVERSWLARTVWPESMLEMQAAYNLRRALTELRKAMGTEADCLQSPNRASLALDLEQAEVDVIQFDRLIKRTTDRPALEQAVALHRGPLLESWEAEWIDSERASRAELLLATLERLAEDDRRQGRPAQATVFLRRALALAPERENICQLLINCLADSGDRAGIIQVYREFRLHLRQHLNAEPARETRALYERLTNQPEVRPPPTPRPAAPSLAPVVVIASGPVGGAMPLNSRFYVERPADALCADAIARGDGMVLLKGPRETGKSSLLARTLAVARQQGHRVLLTDLQSLTSDMGSTDALFIALVRQLSNRLGVNWEWDEHSPPGDNVEKFLTRNLLQADTAPIVWGWDEVDTLFVRPVGNEVFALLRSWYNSRALDPDRVWNRLTMVLCYATEARLFITDLNQSPFNVGTRLTLDDFLPAQISDLNARYGGPLRTAASVARLQAIVGGHPYLVQTALSSLLSGRHTLEELEKMAGRGR